MSLVDDSLVDDQASDCWQLDNWSARLRSAHVSGDVDLRRPWQGVCLPEICGAARGANLLGVVIDQLQTSDAWQPADAYVRGNDLAVQYEPTPQRPFRIQVYWRMLEAASRLVDGIALDAIVSLQTPLWEAFPSLSVASTIPCDATVGIGPHSAPFTTAHESAGDWHVQATDDVSIVRIDSAKSYAKAGRVPGDFDSWDVIAQPDGFCRCESQFSPKFMEKGVIRRLQIRAAILSRQDDVRQAIALSDRLSQERPPLTA